MLEVVAPEANYEQISGQILQNHDFLVGGKSGWYSGGSLEVSWKYLKGLWEVSGRSLGSF